MEEKMRKTLSLMLVLGLALGLTACNKNNLKLVLPEKRYCTDNGAMIAAEGYIQYKKGNFTDMKLNAKAVVPLK